MTDTFCILPWIHLSVTPGSFARLCCQAWGYIMQDGSPMSMYSYPIDEIWNSDYMRQVRQNMLEGKEVSACAGCRNNEKKIGSSYRILSNNEWGESIGSFDSLTEFSRNNDYKALSSPISFHLIPGTLCNLKCRMCSTLFSSQIQKDSVHSEWCPPQRFLEPQVIEWKSGEISIGPEAVVGVESSGFYDAEIHDNRILRWTHGDALLSFGIPPNLAMQKLKINIWEHHPQKYSFLRKLFLRLQSKKFRGHNLKVFVNNRQLANEEMAAGKWERNFDLSEKVYNGQVTVRLLSDTFRVPLDSRRLGVAVEKVEITCSETGSDAQAHQINESSHLLPKVPWYEQTDWILSQLLRNQESLRELQFSGGEPMLQRQVEEIIDFCIDRQIANNICLKFNLNCTVLPERMLKKLEQFKKNFIAVSIDAFGPYWEYIRYPGKWEQVNKHLERLKGLSNAFVVMVPVLQVYNALNIVELLRYADQSGLDCWLYPLTDPWYLSVSILPSKVRKIAGQRLRTYAATECRQEMREHVTNMANYIESVDDNCTPDSLKTLMHFTNDLDQTRNQSFRETHSELLELIEGTGFHWSDERRFA